MIMRKLYYLKKVQEQQWMKPKELEKLQNKKLRAIIKHAFKFVPYYRRKWKTAGIREDDIKVVEDLKKLPTITRKEVVKNYNQFIALNYKKTYRFGRVVRRYTSGTSGTPFRTIFDERAYDYSEAVYLRALLAVGYNPRKPLACYWYEPFEKKIYNQFGFMNKIYIPCSISEEEQLEIIQNMNPEYIYYYPSILYSIAKKMVQRDISLNPKAVITHAEILSKKMRRIIQMAFNSPVFDEYGANEFNRIAWECKEREGYHVDSDSVIMEILKEGEKIFSDETGSVVLTGLENFILPLIRYEIGDMATPTDGICSCGRGLPLIKSIEGRSEDLIILNSGKTFVPKRIIDTLADIPEIYKFRVSYKGNNRFFIDLVLLYQSDRIFDKIEKRLKNLFKENIRISFKIKKEIKKSRGGKRKLVTIV